MATVKFAETSPYLRAIPGAHASDFKHKRYLVEAGLESSNTEKRSKQTTPKRVNIALFAIGRAGSIHLGNLLKNPRTNLKYVVEPNRTKLNRVAAEWRLPEESLLNSDQAEQVFQDPSVDGIIIATPTYLHKDLVIRGLQSGKAVFCEKPIAEDMKDTEYCYDIAKKAGKPLLCAFNRRFDPSFGYLRDQVHTGAVGQVHMIKTVARDSPLPSLEYLKISGGIFHDCAVHDVDLICWILGEYPVQVYASATAFIPEVKGIQDFDTVAFTMTFPSGAISTTDLSRCAVYGYDQRIEVFGPKGMVSAGNERPSNVTFSTGAGETLTPILHSFPSRYFHGYERELEHFCDIIQGLDECSVPKENTLKISIIATALEESARTGQPVKLKY